MKASYCSLEFAQGVFPSKNTEEGKPKTTFATQRWFYQFCDMLFWLATSPMTFKRLAELVLNGFQWKRCLVYFDDMI